MLTSVKKETTGCSQCQETILWAKGYCRRCYNRMYQNGSLAVKRRKIPTMCCEPDCIEPAYARDMCHNCYFRAMGKIHSAEKGLTRTPLRDKIVAHINNEPQPRYEDLIMTCHIENCEKDGTVRGYCNTHYQALLRTGKLKKKEAAICAHPEGCPEIAKSRGLCRRHYYAAWYAKTNRHRTALDSRPRILIKGKTVKQLAQELSITEDSIYAFIARNPKLAGIERISPKNASAVDKITDFLKEDDDSDEFC